MKALIENERIHSTYTDHDPFVLSCPTYPDGTRLLFVDCPEGHTTWSHKYVNGKWIPIPPVEDIDTCDYYLLTIYLINDCSRRCSYCPCGEWNVVRPEDFEDAKKNGYPLPGKPNMLNKDSLIKWISKHINKDKWKIEITGGEPSMVPWCNDLLQELSDLGYDGIIRHNGDFPLIKTDGFLRVTAWHDPFPTEVKYPGDVFLVLDEEYKKRKWCREHGFNYKLIYKNTAPKPEDIKKTYRWKGWAYMYSCGQLSAGNGCNTDPDHSYNLHELNIWNDSKPLIRESPCSGCNSIVGYQFVKPLEVV